MLSGMDQTVNLEIILKIKWIISAEYNRGNL